MKAADSFRIRRAMLASTLSIGVGFASTSFAFDYSALDLGGFDTPTGATSFATNLNSTGRVVGFSSQVENGLPVYSSFITGPNGVGQKDLENLPNSILSFPWAVNSGGQVAGFSGSVVDWRAPGEGSVRAFITGPDGSGITDLGTAGRTHSAAFGLNDSGQAVGASFAAVLGNDPIAFQAFITGPNGTDIRDIATPEGFSSIATGINSSGHAVGVYGFNDTETELGRAFITGPNGMDVRDLGTLGGTGSGASAINDEGQVVGASNPTGTTGPDNVRAFITGPNGQGMSDLGALGANYSAAADINASGQVVGSYGPNIDATRAFITGPDGSSLADLTSLVRLPDGVVLGSAQALNDRGQVLALGSNDHHYLLTPGDGSTADAPLLPNFIQGDAWRFDFETRPDQWVFVDPIVAAGYDYVVNSGSNIQTAMFPAVAGDTNGYDVYGFNTNTSSYDIFLGHVNPGEPFDFGSGGTSRFALRGIDITAALDPNNPLAFPTGLTFTGSGTVSMLQDPLAVDVPVIPEPETYAMFLAGLGLMSLVARRRKQDARMVG